MFIGTLRKLYEGLDIALRNAGFFAGKSGRHMKFPYTISAKIAQFPFFFYCRNNNIWMYWVPGLVVSFYVFGKIHRLVNSPQNVASWAAQQRKNAAAEAHH